MLPKLPRCPGDGAEGPDAAGFDPADEEASSVPSVTPKKR